MYFVVIFWLHRFCHNQQIFTEVPHRYVESCPTSAASLNLISYMRMRPLGCGGCGQRRNTQSSLPSQVTGPGMSSAFSEEPQGE